MDACQIAVSVETSSAGVTVSNSEAVTIAPAQVEVANIAVAQLDAVNVQAAAPNTVNIVAEIGAIGPPGPAGPAGPAGEVPVTFEWVNRNLSALGAVMNRDASGKITSIEYDDGLVKTFARDANGQIESLAFTHPDVTETTKTFTRDGSGRIAAFSYS